MIGEQLPLSVHLPDSASFDNFHAGPNLASVSALQRIAEGEAAEAGNLLLHGAPGTGKTHLLQAAVRTAIARRRAATYLPLATLQPGGPEALAGFEHYELVCLDDVDAALLDRAWAQGVLRLLDAVRTHGGQCALAALAAPARLAIAPLPDLRTRLSASAVFGLRPLGDDDRLLLLRSRARRLGLDLAPEVVQWMTRHLPRDAGSLIGALGVIDRAALAARRKPTLPFVQKLLGGG